MGVTKTGSYRKPSSNHKYANTAATRTKKANKRRGQTPTKDLLKRSSAKTVGPNSFPGRIFGSAKHKDGTKGLFVKSIKGQKGKFFVEKGLRAATEEFLLK